MNGLKNQVTLIGHLGQDFDLKTLASQKCVAKASLATNNYYKNSLGETVQETSWHHLVVWGRTAENITTITSKGDEIMIRGRISYRSYEDQNGIKKYITEIIVSEFSRISKSSAATIAA